MSYFEKLLILEYYDGPVAGVGVMPDGSAYYFTMVAWDEEQDERVFALAEVSARTAEELWAACAAAEAPRFPVWWLQGTGSADAEAKVDAAIVAVRAESKSGIIANVVQSQDLVGAAIVAVVDREQAQVIRQMIGSSANVWHARRRSALMKTVYSSFPQTRRILSLR